MKTKNAFVFLIIMIVLFQGCIPSLHPLYTEDKLVVKKEILGTWIDEEGEDIENLAFSEDGKPVSIDPSRKTPGVWKFEAGKDKNYYLELYDEEKRSAGFDVHMVKLGDNYYFDFYPTFTKEESEQVDDFDLFSPKFNDFEGYHYQPVHTFGKVTFDGNQISIAMFNGELLDELLNQKRIRIKHEKTDHGFIFTAQPEELQQFIVKYAEDEKAFLDPIILKKPV